MSSEPITLETIHELQLSMLAMLGELKLGQTAAVAAAAQGAASAPAGAPSLPPFKTSLTTFLCAPQSSTVTPEDSNKFTGAFFKTMAETPGGQPYLDVLLPIANVIKTAMKATVTDKDGNVIPDPNAATTIGYARDSLLSKIEGQRSKADGKRVYAVIQAHPDILEVVTRNNVKKSGSRGGKSGDSTSLTQNQLNTIASDANPWHGQDAGNANAAGNPAGLSAASGSGLAPAPAASNQPVAYW